MKKKQVVFGMLGMSLDNGRKEKRHTDWRPTVALFKHQLNINRLELWYQPIDHVPRLKDVVAGDIKKLSPKASLNFHAIQFEDPWDFEEVYLKLYDFAKSYPWNLDQEEYFLHITTGTHVMQVCYFALAEAHIIPAKLIQTGEDISLKEKMKKLRGAKQKAKAVHEDPLTWDRSKGVLQIIDLRSERYTKIASRFQEQNLDNLSILKAGISTKNATYNHIIGEIETVAQLSDAPLLLTGETGVGKTALARRIFELKCLNPISPNQNKIEKKFIEVNCATLQGTMAMSTLFGHRKGAFTGAVSDRIGLLKEADKGVMFLDEIGELGLDEQAMLLRAIEDKEFRPLGSEKTVKSNFVLIAGTNRNLRKLVSEGEFRDDLLARIDVWEFHLPRLKDRIEDFEPNIDYELSRFSQQMGRQIRFSSEAIDLYVAFRREGRWSGNFRDLKASMTRMGTLSLKTGIIERTTVEQEIRRLTAKWRFHPTEQDELGFDVSQAIVDHMKYNAMTAIEKKEVHWIL